MNTRTHTPWGARTKRAGLGVALLPGVFFLAACDSLLEIDAPDRVPAEFLAEPAQAQLLVTSAIADFDCAFADYILAGGLVGTELADAQLGAAMWSFDRRAGFEAGSGQYATSTCGSSPTVYRPLSTARFSADNAVNVLEGASDADVSGRQALIATANAYAGYSRLLLGEGMCSAAIDVGPELTSQQLFGLAEEKFTQVLNNGSAPAAIRDMALVGRARARLNQGNTSGAASDAEGVSAGFKRNATYSAASGRSSNFVWVQNQRSEGVSVEDYYWNVKWKGVTDPRVAVKNEGRKSAWDNLTPFWTQQKYPTQESPIPIARYAEAQLILAEVRGGQTAVGIINALHAAAGIPAYDPATDGPIAAQVIEERSRELFLESHHLYDKIRLGLPFLPVAGTPFQKTGAKGGFYGNMTCFPIPLVETDYNPNIKR